MTREDWLRREDRKRYTLSALASFLLLGLVSVAGIPLSGRPGALTVPRVDEFAVSLEVRAGQSEPAGRTTAPDADQAALGHHGPGTEPPRPSPAPQPAREDAAAPVASVTAAPKPAQPRPSDDAQAASGAADAAENDSGTEGSPPPAQETMQGSRWLEGAPPASGAGEGSPGSRNEGASAGREGMDGSPGPAADSAASTGATTDPTAALSAQLGAFIEVNKVYPEGNRLSRCTKRGA